MMPATRITTPAGYVASDCISEEFSRRRIYVTGEITEAMSSEICCQINQLAAMSNEDITLWIKGPGGNVSDGMAILDTMMACGCDIRTVVMGTASSMAAVIASSGTKGKRFIGANAEMMIHQALGGVSGQTTDILRAADHIQKLNNKLYTILAQSTGKNIQKIAADCDRDKFMDAHEAIRYGLVDCLFSGFDN